MTKAITCVEMEKGRSVVYESGRILSREDISGNWLCGPWMIKDFKKVDGIKILRTWIP